MGDPTPQADADRGLWQRRAFVSVFIGSTISLLGDGLYTIALPWWVLQVTGSTTAMAAVGAAETLTQAVAGPFMGTVADRVNRRWAMVTMDLARAALVSVPALLILGGHGNLAAILAVAAALSLCSSLFNPAMGASMLDIAGRANLLQANAIRTTTQQLGQLASISLGGTIVGLIGAAGAMLADAASFLASAAAVLAAGAFAGAPKARRSSFGQDLHQGLGYVRRTPVILGIISIGAFLNLVAVPLMVYLAPLAKGLGAGAQGFGWLMGALLLGFALGATLLGPLAARWPWRKGLLGCTGTVLAGLAMFGMGLGHSLLLALAGAVALGAFISWPNVIISTGIQAMVPQELQGRVGGLMNMVLTALQPVGYVIGGTLADRFATGPLIRVSGGLLALIALITFAIPGIRDVP